MANYLTKPKLQRYHDGLLAKVASLVPSKTSELSNDSGFVTEAALTRLSGEIERDGQAERGEYPGRLLTQIPDLAQEIANDYSGDVVEFLHQRASAGDFSGLRVGDAFAVEHAEYGQMAYQIGGFNCLAAETSQLPHIVCVPSSAVYSPEWSGDSTDAPYAESSLHGWETGAFLSGLPESLRSYLYERTAPCESCDSSSDWSVDRQASLGKVWSLSEVEVFGSCIWGLPGYGGLGQRQLPLFRNTGNVVWDFSDSWWLRSLGVDGYFIGACYVTPVAPLPQVSTSTGDQHAARPCFMLG